MLFYLVHILVNVLFKVYKKFLITCTIKCIGDTFRDQNFCTYYGGFFFGGFVKRGSTAYIITIHIYVVITEVVTMIVASNQFHKDDGNGTHHSRFHWAPSDNVS